MTAQPVDARVSQEDIRRMYDRMSRFYNLWARVAESKARRRALELAAVRDGQSVLEVAVGTGLAFEEIIKRNPHGRNSGLDISEGMLSRARQRLSGHGKANYELKLGSAFDLPYPGNHFDLLLNNYMFDLIPFEAMGRILEEFRRVLKPEGSLVLANMAVPRSWRDGLYEGVYRMAPRLMGGCRGVQMVARLASRGFHVETQEYIRQFGFPSEVISAKKKVP
jgi:ubiquinone/menaquinone biosynthesis C-methylase UbiE